MEMNIVHWNLHRGFKKKTKLDYESTVINHDID
jgi:hypothetical protein